MEPFLFQESAAPIVTIHLGDAVQWLRSLGTRSVDLVITDPAYESLEKHRKIGTTTRLKRSAGSSNDWFEIFPNARFEEFFVEVWRVLKSNAHFYMWCDAETMFVAKPIAEKCGLRWRHTIVHDKKSIGMGYHYRARYEFILFFEKGERKLNDLGCPDVLECKRIRSGYPTEKPVAINEVLVLQSSEPGELVIDPFMGPGSTGVAALLNGRRFAGNDLSQKSLDWAGPRLLATKEREFQRGWPTEGTGGSIRVTAARKISMLGVGRSPPTAQEEPQEEES